MIEPPYTLFDNPGIDAVYYKELARTGPLYIHLNVSGCPCVMEATAETRAFRTIADYCVKIRWA